MFKIPRNKLEWADDIGSWSGVAAALLITSHVGLEWLAFTVFIISCSCYIYVGRVKNLGGMTRMNVIFLIINMWGLWRWLIGPLLGF